MPQKKVSATIHVTAVIDGQDGQPGAEGNGIQSVARTYAVSSQATTASDATPPSDVTAWAAASPATTEAKPYLWAKEVVTYTKAATTTKYYMIGARGQNGIDAQDIEWAYIRTKTDTPPVIAADSSYTDSNGNAYTADDHLPHVTGNSNIESDNSGVSGKTYECTDDPKGVNDEWPYEWEIKREKGTADANGHRAWTAYSGTMTLHNNLAASLLAIDIDNDSDQFGVDADGKVLAQQARSTVVSMAYGTEPQAFTAAPTASLRYDDGTTVESGVATADVAVVANTDSKQYRVTVTVKATGTNTPVFGTSGKNGLYVDISGTCARGTKTIRFSLAKVMGGASGQNPVIWQLNPSRKSFVFGRDASNNLTPASVASSIYVTRTEGNTTTEHASTRGLTNPPTFSWGFDSSSTAQATAQAIGTAISISNSDAASHSSVWVKLSTGDRETLPILKDGAKGDDGNGIQSVARTYAVSSQATTASDTTPPSDVTAWAAASPATTEAKPYLWTKEVVTYTKAASTTKYYMIGARGQNGIDAQDIEWAYIRTKTNTAPVIATDSSYTDSKGKAYTADDHLPHVTGNTNIESDNSGVSGKTYECTDDPKGVNDEWPYEWEIKREKGTADANGHRAWTAYSGTMTLHNNLAASLLSIDIDNDSDQFGVDADGKVLAQQARSTVITMVYGTALQQFTAAPTVSLRYDDGTTVASSVATADVAVVANTDNTQYRVTVTVKATGTNTPVFGASGKSGLYVDISGTCSRGTKTVRFSLNKVMGGASGETPVIWQLNPSKKSFVFGRDASNNLTPPNVASNIYVTRTEGNTTTEHTSTSGLTNPPTFSWGFDSESTARTSGQAIGTVINISNSDAASHSSVWVKLSTGDRETLPILKDGAKGEDGIDAQDFEWAYIRTKGNTQPRIADSSGTDGNRNELADDDYMPSAYIESAVAGGIEANAIDSSDHPNTYGSNNYICGECTDDPKGVDDTWPYEWEIKREKGAADANGHRAWQPYSGKMALHNMAAHSVNPNILLRTIFDRGIDFVLEAWRRNSDNYAVIDTASDTVVNGRKSIRLDAMNNGNFVSFYQSLLGKLKANTWYSLSFNAFIASGGGNLIVSLYNLFGGTRTNIFGNGLKVILDGEDYQVSNDGNNDVLITGGWDGKRHTITFLTNSSISTETLNLQFYQAYGSGTGNHSISCICMPKLEESRVSTAYMAHEDDLEGDAAEVYSLQCSPAAVNFRSDAVGEFSGSYTVGCKVMKTVGNNTTEMAASGGTYDGMYLKCRKLNTSGNYTSWDAASSVTLTPSDALTNNYVAVEFVLSANSSMTAVKARASVPIMCDGHRGASGATGRMFRPRGTYNVSATYVRDNDFVDLVFFDDGVYNNVNGARGHYYYISDGYSSNVSGSTHYAPAPKDGDGNSYPYSEGVWSIASDFGVVITQAIFAEYAKMGSAIITGDWMLSQHGTADGVFYNSYDFLTAFMVGSNQKTSIHPYTLFNGSSPTGGLVSVSTHNTTISRTETSHNIISARSLKSGLCYKITCRVPDGYTFSGVPVQIQIDKASTYDPITLLTVSEEETVYTTYVMVPVNTTYRLRLVRSSTASQNDTISTVIEQVTFGPQYAVDLLTGLTYMVDAYVKGDVIRPVLTMTQDNSAQYVIHDSAAPATGGNLFFVDLPQAFRTVQITMIQDGDGNLPPSGVVYILLPEVRQQDVGVEMTVLNATRTGSGALTMYVRSGDSNPKAGGYGSLNRWLLNGIFDGNINAYPVANGGDLRVIELAPQDELRLRAVQLPSANNVNTGSRGWIALGQPYNICEE